MQSVVEWLLEVDQPAIRYQTLVDILDLHSEHEDVQEAYSRIPGRGWAAKILAEQLPGVLEGNVWRFQGYWHNYILLNRPKYVATLWKFLVLVDFGLTAKNDQILKTCRLLDDRYLKRKENFHLCMTSNIARAFVRAGFDEGIRGAKKQENGGRTVSKRNPRKERERFQPAILFASRSALVLSAVAFAFAFYNMLTSGLSSPLFLVYYLIAMALLFTGLTLFISHYADKHIHEHLDELDGMAGQLTGKITELTGKVGTLTETVDRLGRESGKLTKKTDGLATKVGKLTTTTKAEFKRLSAILKKRNRASKNG